MTALKRRKTGKWKMDFSKPEKRSKIRKPCNEAVKIIVQEAAASQSPKTFTAQVVDISSTGMGIQLEFNLKKGQTILFKEGQDKWGLPSQGLVVWSLTHNSLCRAGLEFIL